MEYLIGLFLLFLVLGLLGFPIWVGLLGRTVDKRREAAIAEAEETYDELFVGPTAVYESSDATIPLDDVIAEAERRGYEVTAVTPSGPLRSQTVTFKRS